MVGDAWKCQTNMPGEGSSDLCSSGRKLFPEFPYNPYASQTAFMEFLYSVLEQTERFVDPSHHQSPSVGSDVRNVSASSRFGYHTTFESSDLHPYDEETGGGNFHVESTAAGGPAPPSDCRIALMESPTGTGKTISLICACLHWLEDHTARTRVEARWRRRRLEEAVGMGAVAAAGGGFSGGARGLGGSVTLAMTGCNDAATSTSAAGNDDPEWLRDAEETLSETLGSRRPSRRPPSPAAVRGAEKTQRETPGSGSGKASYVAISSTEAESLKSESRGGDAASRPDIPERGSDRKGKGRDARDASTPEGETENASLSLGPAEIPVWRLCVRPAPAPVSRTGGEVRSLADLSASSSAIGRRPGGPAAKAGRGRLAEGRVVSDTPGRFEDLENLAEFVLCDLEEEEDPEDAKEGKRGRRGCQASPAPGQIARWASGEAGGDGDGDGDGDEEGVRITGRSLLLMGRILAAAAAASPAFSPDLLCTPPIVQLPPGVNLRSAGLCLDPQPGVPGGAPGFHVPGRLASASYRRTQVIFATRTHSQLTQFVREVARTGFARRLTLQCLAARRVLCVNDDVRRLGAAGLINERCIELMQKKPVATRKVRSVEPTTPGSVRRLAVGGCSSGGCPFLAAAAVDNVYYFGEAAAAAPLDVEDLGSLGRDLGVCPYYGARMALPYADVLAVPYAALLHDDTRASLGVDLHGAVVVIDEAHNLVDAVNGAHSAAVTQKQIVAAIRSVHGYLHRFKARLSLSNARRLQILQKALARMLASTLPVAVASEVGPESAPLRRGAVDCETAAAADVGVAVAVVPSLQLLLDSGLDGLDLPPLLRWSRSSKLVMKIAQYDAAVSTASAADRFGSASGHESVAELRDKGSSSAPEGGGAGRGAALQACLSFLSALAASRESGRVIVARQRPDGGGQERRQEGDPAAGLKYVLLDAAEQFAKVLESSRAVVLASGTLAPVDALAAQLFPSLPPTHVHSFSCGHVVPPDQLVVVTAAKGPSGVPLDFRYENRGKMEVMLEAGRLLANLCRVVPGGLVAFVSSFAYLAQLEAAWRAAGVWDSLVARKKVFLEPRAAADVDVTLRAYAAACRNDSTPAAGAVAGGGLLLSVVGGKLSEGINFQDELGRCVVMIGLPYPSPKDVELQERLRFIDRGGRSEVCGGRVHVTAAESAQAARCGSSAPPTGSSVDAPSHHGPCSGRLDAVAGCTVPYGSGVLKPIPTPALEGVVGDRWDGLGDGASLAQGKVSVKSSCSLKQKKVLTGRSYMEGLCTKAVHQCLGRVLRHVGDYAAVVLVDVRYLPSGPGIFQPSEFGGPGTGMVGGAAAVARFSAENRGTIPPGTRSTGQPAWEARLDSTRLPGWMRQSFCMTDGSFGPLYRQLSGFFNRRAEMTRGS